MNVAHGLTSYKIVNQKHFLTLQFRSLQHCRIALKTGQMLAYIHDQNDSLRRFGSMPWL
jgi:hypothetical protein